jgi:hypothetical protein
MEDYKIETYHVHPYTILVDMMVGEKFGIPSTHADT